MERKEEEKNSKNMEYEMTWDDVIDYLNDNKISRDEKKELLDLIDYDYTDDIDFRDVIDYLERNSCYDEDEVLDAIGHNCDVTDIRDKILRVETLDDEFKFETIKNLYNRLSSQQWEKIEKMVDLKVI